MEKILAYFIDIWYNDEDNFRTFLWIAWWIVMILHIALAVAFQQIWLAVTAVIAGLGILTGVIAWVKKSIEKIFSPHSRY